MKGWQNISTIVTDASCFILFDKIDCLEILHKLYGQVITTPEIAAEFGKRLPEWVIVQPVVNRNLLYTYAELVDIGEASALALASEVILPNLILDDQKGRKLAEELNLEYTGSIGVLVLARVKRIIPNLKPYFDKVSNTNFRIPSSLLHDLVNKYDK